MIKHSILIDFNALLNSRAKNVREILREAGKDIYMYTHIFESMISETTYNSFSKSSNLAQVQSTKVVSHYVRKSCESHQFMFPFCTQIFPTENKKCH